MTTADIRTLLQANMSATKNAIQRRNADADWLTTCIQPNRPNVPVVTMSSQKHTDTTKCASPIPATTRATNRSRCVME